MNIVEKARIFSIAAHSAINQRRKYTNEPYWVHPVEVAEIVRLFPHTPEMVAAAYLHDVVEDTYIGHQLIIDEFGDEIGSLVKWLTNVSTPDMGNRAVRKEIDRQYLAQAPAEAQTIKSADLWSNTKTIVDHDPKFAKIYLKEKRELLSVLTKADPGILEKVYQGLETAEKTLNFAK